MSKRPDAKWMRKEDDQLRAAAASGDAIAAISKRHGEIDGVAFVDRIAALADDRGSYFNSDGLPGSCVYPEQGSCD
jgi:hypothetical protein